ncbi:MAG: DUF3800 domain-containing protein [Dehalococcoidia bacterium]|nr:DUF3800 domain-containing protein [Dehalococcoidia bacterium]
MAVAIKAYCDCSGKSDDPRSEYLTLAGCIATPEAWYAFEKRWGEALIRNHCDYLHMKEANALQGAFSVANGWTAIRVSDLLSDLASSCFPTETIVSANCTVNLPDYRRAVEIYPQLRNYRPEQFCVTHVVNVAASMLPTDNSRPFGKDGTAELFFDKNESFMKHVYKEWKRRGAKRDVNWGLISSVGAVDSKTVYGLQAADFLAWNINRYFVTRDADHAEIAMRAVPNIDPVYMDYDSFIATAKEEWPS